MNAFFHHAHHAATDPVAAIAVMVTAIVAAAAVAQGWRVEANQVLPANPSRSVVRIRKTVGLKPRWPGGFERGNPKR